LNGYITDLNKDLEDHDINLDKEKRKLDDRNLLKKQMEVTMQLNQESNKVHIDISIAESRIRDLTGLREMSLSQIKDILADKRQVDKENVETELKIQGKGVSEQEQKVKIFDAEREQLKKISNSLKFKKENAENLMERLKDEETKAKDLLDEKIKLQQILSQNTEELNEEKGFSTRNREEIIRMQIKFSQLQTHEDKMKTELEGLVKENDFFLKKN
jgi:hypothetical protein